jgi:hypothetical protein
MPSSACLVLVEEPERRERARHSMPKGGRKSFEARNLAIAVAESHAIWALGRAGHARLGYSPWRGRLAAFARAASSASSGCRPVSVDRALTCRGRALSDIHWVIVGRESDEAPR